jgi:hypothetical protein
MGIEFHIFWHVYVVGGAYFERPWDSRVPHRKIVTLWHGSVLLDMLTLGRVTYALCGRGEQKRWGKRE